MTAESPKRVPEPRHEMPRGPRLTRLLFWALVAILLGPWLVRLLIPQGAPKIPYSLFREQLDSGTVAEVTVRGEVIEGSFSDEVEIGSEGDTTSDFVTYLPSFGDDELLAKLESQGVALHTEPAEDPSLLLGLVSFLPLLALFGLGYLVFRRMGARGGQLLSIGKSSARRYEQSDRRTTFDDVAGAEGAKTELCEIIDFLKSPERTRRLGGKPPRGVLLVGPPGTGKTLLARATAGQADVPFFSITGSDFMEMFVGVGASRVRDLFKEARAAAPAIVFIDELDSIGRHRGAGLGGGHDEREQTLNQLLSELDGFEAHDDVILLAATNRPDILDPALLRPGRFDRRIIVDAPGKSARQEILEVHARDKPLAGDVDLEEVARGTPGFSGADLENLLNEAALLAAREGKARVQAEDIDAARDKILLGLEREGLALTREECRLIAYHEAGHAVVAAVTPGADPLHKVSIVPRGQAMGVTQQLPERDRYIYPRQQLLDRMAVMMGGRAAEQLALETMTSGAENDLQQASELARRMVLHWGMSDRLGPVAQSSRRQHVFLGEEIAEGREYSEATAREIDEEVRGFLQQAYQRAEDLLATHRRGLDRLAEALLDEEELSGTAALRLIGVDAAGTS